MAEQRKGLGAVGRTISLQLPLDQDRIVRAKARALGLPINGYCRMLLIQATSNQDE